MSERDTDPREADRGHRQTFREAIETWGAETQIDLALEELGELQTALARHRRGRADVEDVAEEIADVRIMARQLSVVYGEDRVDSHVERKMERLRERLDDAE